MLIDYFARFRLDLWLLIFLSVAATDPTCSLLYGRPIYSDCLDLISILYSGGWPGESPDPRKHFFSISGALVPDYATAGARHNRKFLPMIAVNGKSFNTLYCQSSLELIHIIRQGAAKCL